MSPGRLVVLMGAISATALIIGIIVLHHRQPAVYAVGVRGLIDRFRRGEAPRDVRLGGVLISGSIRPSAQPCGVEFDIGERFTSGNGSSAEPRIHARYAGCLFPDTFCDVPGRTLNIALEGHPSACESGLCFDVDHLFAMSGGRYDLSRVANDPCAGASWRPFADLRHD